MGQIDKNGNIKMVNVTEKSETHRTARGHARIWMSPEAFRVILQNKVKKGDVLTSAKIAGIMAAKKTGELIPLCHPLNLTFVDILFRMRESDNSIEIESFAELTGKTGVEMEALIAASTAALTIYDMVKSIDKTIQIGEIYLLEKTGGKSGHYIRKNLNSI